MKDNPIPEQGFIGENQLMKLLPVCRRTIISYRQKGIIPHVRLGDRVLYSWPQVKAALERNTKATA